MIMSDAGMSFVSKKFRDFCRCLTICQVISSSYNHQSNRHTEACIRIIKRAMKKCISTNRDVNLVLLQIKSTAMRSGLPSLGTLLFNKLKSGIMPKLKRPPIFDDGDDDDDDDDCDAFIKRQQHAHKNNDTDKDSLLVPTGSTAAVQRKMAVQWTHCMVVGH